MWNTSEIVGDGDSMDVDKNSGTAFLKIHLFVYIIVGAPAVFSNVPILYVAYKTGRFQCLAFLAAADMTYGMAFLTAGPVRLVYLYQGRYYTKVSPLWCLLTPWFYGFHLGFVWPSLGVALLAVERAIALMFPLWYKTHWTGKLEAKFIKTAGAVVLCFFVPAPIVCLLSHFAGEIVSFQCSAADATSRGYLLIENLFGITLGYAVCVLSAVSYVIGVRQMQNTGVANNQGLVLREKRLTKAIGLVVLLTLFLNIIPVTIQLIDSNKRYGFVALPEVVVRIFLVQACLNSVVNLYIYLFFNSQFRKSMKKCLPWLFSSASRAEYRSVRLLRQQAMPFAL